jgi:hypothetical protein
MLGCVLVCALFAPGVAARPDAGPPFAAADCASASRAPAVVRRSAALETYDDFIEDTRGPDICGENVVTNDNEGTITVGLHIHNRRSWAANESYGMFLNTDNDPSTGPEGADYVVRIATGMLELEKWDGAAFVVQGQLPPAEWAPSYGPVFQLNASDLGGAESFGFVFYSTDGTNVDYAPNRDAWSYALTPLALSAGSLTLDRARQGRAFTARMLVIRSDFDIELTEGRIACTAQLGSKTLVGAGRFIGPRVACTWRLPKGSQRKRLSGSVSIAFQGVEAKRSFATTVRR